MTDHRRRKGEPTVTQAESADLRPQVPGGQIVERDGIQRLERVFKFDDIARALVAGDGITNQAAGLAEGHHPAIVTEWGGVTVT